MIIKVPNIFSSLTKVKKKTLRKPSTKVQKLIFLIKRTVFSWEAKLADAMKMNEQTREVQNSREYFVNNGTAHIAAKNTLDF